MFETVFFEHPVARRDRDDRHRRVDADDRPMHQSSGGVAFGMNATPRPLSVCGAMRTP
jgi:hypothetical protein